MLANKVSHIYFLPTPPFIYSFLFSSSPNCSFFLPFIFFTPFLLFIKLVFFLLHLSELFSFLRSTYHSNLTIHNTHSSLSSLWLIPFLDFSLLFIISFKLTVSPSLRSSLSCHRGFSRPQWQICGRKICPFPQFTANFITFHEKS